MLVTTPAVHRALLCQGIARISTTTYLQRIENLANKLRLGLALNIKVINTKLSVLIRAHTVHLTEFSDHEQMVLPTCNLLNSKRGIATRERHRYWIHNELVFFCG